MQKIINNQIENRVNIQGSIAYGLLGLIAVFFVLYLYFVSSLSFDIVARKNIENTIRITEAEISKLELDYFNKTSSLTLDYAKEKGFVEENKAVFTSRTARTAWAVISEQGEI